MKEITEIPEKEVEQFQGLIAFVKGQAEMLEVKTKEDFKKATELLSQVVQVEKTIQERKEKITRPLMAGLSEARELFKPMEAGNAEAKKTIKAKMLDYSIAEQERVDIEKLKVEKRVEKGTMRTDTALKKLEDIGEAPKTGIRTVTKIRIVDESLVPREYLIPDLVKITKAVLKDQLQVTGVETYEEKSIVATTR